MFPAWFDLNRDKLIRARPAAISVYAVLLGDFPDILHKPIPIKLAVLQKALNVEAKTVIGALNLLIDRGFLLEQGRALNGVRKLQVPIERIHS